MIEDEIGEKLQQVFRENFNDDNCQEFQIFEPDFWEGKFNGAF